MIMKKNIMIMISVMMIALSGCGKVNDIEVVSADTEQAIVTGEEDAKITTVEADVVSTEEIGHEDITTDEVSTVEKEVAGSLKKQEEPAKDLNKSEDATTGASQMSSDTGTTEEYIAPVTETTVSDVPTTEEQTTEANVTETPVSYIAEYSPQSVVSLATSKCIAGGMIRTTDNLDNMLAEGSITQEEYNSYYPYDGLGYYSVFVETDLNIAATVSGRPLRSEDEVATHIANMLLLEREPYFLIEYAGVYNSGGTDFYEFRCYR